MHRIADASYDFYYYKDGNLEPMAIGHTRGRLGASPRGPAQSLCNQFTAQLHNVGVSCMMHMHYKKSRQTQAWVCQ